VTAWLAETLLAVTALMLAVLAVRRLVAPAFGAGWAYALWAIPAARLVLPPLGLVPLDFSVSPAGLIPPAGGVTALPPASAGPGQWVPFMLASWAGGAVIFLILQWLGYRAFLRRLERDARPARPPVYEGIATFVSRIVEGPVALGLLRRLIVIPADFSRRYTPAERHLAMAHEHAHHRRGDLWWNVLALLVLAANWFNPVAWLAYRAFRTDQELACDAAVAARASAGERCDYARALVKAAAGPGVAATCSMSDTAGLKRRLRMIARHRVSRVRTVGGIAVVATVAFAGFAVGGAPPQPLGAATGHPVRLASIVAAVPAAPASPPDADVAEAASTRAVHRPADREEHVIRAAPPARVDLPPFQPDIFVAPAPAPVPAPAAAPSGPAAHVRMARFVALERLDPGLRAKVEAALARAAQTQAGGHGGAAVLRFASADTEGTFVFRIQINNDNDEGDQP
jgi:beta-lactamase regulating signal transducer with metallopeptidase domain